MTFSLAVRCPRTGQLAAAAVTGTPGVGQLVTWADANVGAATTQSWVNPYLGIDAIDLLGNGHPATMALRAVIALDERAELRQVGIVDANGRSAAHTGTECADWAGHRTDSDYAVQGNMLEGPDVLDACVDAFNADPDADLVDRCIAALCAGEKAGGDRRGSRSAVVLVVDTERYPLWDLRVDDAAEPLEELKALHRRTAETILPQIQRLPKRMRPGSLDTDDQTGLV